MSTWHLYMIRTARGQLYTGIAVDVTRRFAEHRDGGPKASRYLRANGPLCLAYQVPVGDRSLASKAEARVKQLPKREKEEIVRANPEPAALLAILRLDRAVE